MTINIITFLVAFFCTGPISVTGVAGLDVVVHWMLDKTVVGRED